MKARFRLGMNPSDDEDDWDTSSWTSNISVADDEVGAGEFDEAGLLEGLSYQIVVEFEQTEKLTIEDVTGRNEKQAGRSSV